MLCNVFWSFFATFLSRCCLGETRKKSYFTKYDSNPRPDLNSAFKLASLDICFDVIVEIGEFSIENLFEWYFKQGDSGLLW